MIQENTNKAIAINSIIMYARMGINIVLALFTTRFALQALGVADYGLFSVLGSLITFIGVFNTIMLSTCNRFLAVAIGRGDDTEINKVFNVNLVIFLGCAVLMILLVFPIGLWYVNTHINYAGPAENAIIVFCFSVVGSIISTLATPYNGLLMAKERFFLFSFVDVIVHFIRFVVVLLLVYCFTEKLLIYTILHASLIVVPAFVFYAYCKKVFPAVVRWNFVKDKSFYKEVFSFSGWVAYGAVACVARQQGAALIVNAFFNTAMNAALGIANSLNTYITMFANNMTQPMQPQITKSYAAGNTKRTDDLLVMSTKLSFMLMLLISSVFFIEPDWVLTMWLGKVPPYAVSFTVLLIIDNLVVSFNSGLSLVLFASGKIVLYQVVINTLRLLAIVAAFFVLKSGAEPQSLFYAYIFFSVLVVFATQWCLRKTLDYDNKNLIKKSYVPSIITALLFVPIVFIPIDINPVLHIVAALIYLLSIEFCVCLNKKERHYVWKKLKLTKQKLSIIN